MVRQSTQSQGGLAVGEQTLVPRLRPKPSSSMLRSTATKSTVVPSSHLRHPPVFNRSRTDFSVPRTSSPNSVPIQVDTSSFTRRDRQPSQLPTPADRSTTPIQRPRTGPPTKDHRVFSNGPSTKAPPSIGSSGASSEAEKRVRRVFKKSSTPSSDKGYTLGNGSTSSLSTSVSSHFGSRNGSQSSVLGIAVPSTSASSLLHMRQRSGSGGVPRLLTQDLPVSLDSLGATCDSSPSTRYTDSPFSHSSTPSSASSHSPGPAAMLRTISSSPSRPPVARQRNGSIASVISEIGLDPVRESVASTSSESTVRAGEKNKSRSNPKASELALPQTPPMPQSMTSSTASKSTKLAPSPQTASSSRIASPAAGSSRPRWGSGSISIRPSKETITGLGLSIPGTQTSTGAHTLVKSRSRSISSSFGPQKAKKDTATLPVPALSPSPAPPQPSQRSVPRAVAQGLTYNTIPPLRGIGEQENTSKPTPTAAKPGIFFRGRAKSEEKPPEKPTKRGPIAGTGYEGYGTFGKASRGRSGSSGFTRDRSGSQTSNTSRSRSRSGSRGSLEMDEFLLERLKPVVMAGGEVVENYNRPADMVRSGSSPAVLEAGSDSQRGKETPRSGTSLAVVNRGPSPDDKETVAGRRARSPGRSTTPIPAPINTTGHRVRPAPSPVPSVGSARKQSLDATDATPLSAKPKSKRWNFFQKAPAKPTSGLSLAVPLPASSPTIAPIPTILRSTSRRHVPHEPAHYALLDREEQREAQEYVERMHELRQRRAVSNESAASTSSYTHVLRKQQTFETDNLSIGKGPQLLPPYRTVKKLTKAPAPNTSRAAQPVAIKPVVLRIQTVLSEQSKEQGSDAPADVRRDPRPEEFQIGWNWSGLTPTAAPSGLERRKDFVEYDPLDPRGRRPALATAFDDETPIATTYAGNVQWPARNDSISSIPHGDVATPATDDGEHPFALEDLVVDGQLGEEFYTELEGQYGIPPTPATATFAPRAAIKRTNTVKSTTSSLGAPFPYADLCSPLQVTFDSPQVEQVFEEVGQRSPDSASYSPDSPTLPPALPAKPILDKIPIISEPTHFLGPDQPLPFTPPAQSLLSPATPFSISSFINYYEESEAQRAIDMVEPLVYQLDGPEDTSVKTHRATGSNDSNFTISSEGSTLVAAESEVRIRELALIASRWLSFDRVLVSPAHQALQGGDNGRVLVVDGLGIDDWSFYCAHTYPSAKVYNLAQSSFPAQTRPMPASPSVPRPPNHHQIYTPSLAASFPFPKGFFSVICFRFLPSSSDGHWPFILSECKRVLQPGGYLEVTLLDADLTNAGPRTQRAVDLVKAIMQRENCTEGAPYRPASEKVLRILSKKGFEDLSKCFVGLPTVGKVDSRSEMQQDERERSSEDPESIKEVVSQVGRYWYTRCYESVITAQGEHMQRSMWRDRGLLRECRKRRTNFKMMVCCARKPLGARRGSDAGPATTTTPVAATTTTTTTIQA